MTGRRHEKVAGWQWGGSGVPPRWQREPGRRLGCGEEGAPLTRSPARLCPQRALCPRRDLVPPGTGTAGLSWPGLGPACWRGGIRHRSGGRGGIALADEVSPAAGTAALRSLSRRCQAPPVPPRCHPGWCWEQGLGQWLGLRPPPRWHRDGSGTLCQPRRGAGGWWVPPSTPLARGTGVTPVALPPPSPLTLPPAPFFHACPGFLFASWRFLGVERTGNISRGRGRGTVAMGTSARGTSATGGSSHRLLAAPRKCRELSLKGLFRRGISHEVPGGGTRRAPLPPASGRTDGRTDAGPCPCFEETPGAAGAGAVGQRRGLGATHGGKG